MLIYQIINMINGKRYIGQTRHENPKKRWWEHCGSNFSHGLVNAAIRKYGKENFKFEVLLRVGDIDTLNLVEKRLIKRLNTRTPNGYNVSEGGGSIAGIPECMQRGSNHWTARYPNRHLRGEAASFSKITNKQARLIRILYRKRNVAGTRWSQPVLARRFGVWQSTISDIIRGESF